MSIEKFMPSSMDECVCRHPSEKHHRHPHGWVECEHCECNWNEEVQK